MGTRIIFSHRLLVVFVSLLILLAACGQGTSSGTGTNTSPAATPTTALDVFGTPIVFPKTPPQRIVSLLPSTSEILGALHLEQRVVAIDYYTNYPATLTSKPRVSNANGIYKDRKSVV